MTSQRWPVPGNWAWAKAGDVADIVGGGTPSTKDPENFTSKGVPWLTPADLTGHKEVYIGRGARDFVREGIFTLRVKANAQGHCSNVLPGPHRVLRNRLQSDLDEPRL